MASKRNSNRKIQAPNLKDVVAQLVGELGVETVPSGWFCMRELIRESGLPERTLQRRMEIAKVPKRSFRILTNGYIRNMIHYKLTK